MDIKIERSPREIMMDKLLQKEEIEFEDVKALEMFSEVWIYRLFSCGQATVRSKMLEVMTRKPIVYFRPVEEVIGN